MLEMPDAKEEKIGFFVDRVRQEAKNMVFSVFCLESNPDTMSLIFVLSKKRIKNLVPELN